MENELKKLAVVMRDMSDMVGDHHWMAAKAVEDLIKKDARIAELEGALSWHEEQRNDMAELRAELAAIKAQEPALPKGAIMVGRSELALVRNALALDCEQGRPIRGEMLAELDASIDRLDKLYAPPASEAKAQGATDEQAAFEAAVAAVNERGWSTSTDLARQIWDAARIDVADCPPSYRGGKE